MGGVNPSSKQRIPVALQSGSLSPQYITKMTQKSKFETMKKDTSQATVCMVTMRPVMSRHHKYKYKLKEASLPQVTS